MIDRLSNTDPTVMASRAVVGIYAHVIKHCTCKVRGVMAYGAIRRGWQVINELANADHSVVA